MISGTPAAVQQIALTNGMVHGHTPTYRCTREVLYV